MPSSEDYTIVWAGIYQRRVRTHAASAGLSSLKTRARRARLEVWEDNFEVDPVMGPMPCVLVGRRLALLGYKEGRVRLSISQERLAAALEDIDRRLPRTGLRGRAQLHVLVHLENGEDD